MDAETRDAVRDLCLAVAELAVASAPLIGTTTAASVIEKAGRLSERMDQLDAQATGEHL